MADLVPDSGAVSVSVSPVAALDVVAEDAVGSGATGVSVQPTIASVRHAATRADTDRIAPV